jgi:hypothetical protein
MECWAAQLGGCSNKQSREHYISEGLWKNPVLRVRGFPWLSGGEKDLPISSLTAKILCTEHNNRLSPLDSEAIRVFKWLDEIWRLQEVRRKLRRTKFWTVKRYTVNGNLFERWAVKTAIGLCCAFDKNLRWKQTGSPCNQPPVDILKAVYGETPFLAPMGLYLAVDVGDQHELPDAISIEPLLIDGQLVGAILGFKEVRFPIWFNAAPLNHFSLEIDGKKFGAGGVELIHHLRAWRFTIGKTLSQVLSFSWTDR